MMKAALADTTHHRRNRSEVERHLQHAETGNSTARREEAMLLLAMFHLDHDADISKV
jgi:hypothetical protein